MPLTSIQAGILGLLAAHRDPESYVAGASPLNRDAPRKQMPTGKIGLLFLKDGNVVQPDPGRLDEYRSPAGQRRGHWPSSAQIGSSMFERYIGKSGA